jgi:hypothetical protein
MEESSTIIIFPAPTDDFIVKLESLCQRVCRTEVGLILHDGENDA